jgi:hypothetical protein
MGERRLHTLAGALASFVAIRLALLGWMAWAAASTPEGLSLDRWRQWDTVYYLEIADAGYVLADPPKTLNFFPLFPWLLRAFRWTGLPTLAIGLALSNALSVAAAWLLYRGVARYADPATAWRAVLYLAIFPTSYFLGAAYTEVLCLVLTLAACETAAAGRWGLAAILGYLTALTRMPGLAVSPALAVEAWRQRPHGARGWLAALGATLAPWLGLATYLWINWRVSGSPWTFLETSRAHWHKAFAWPWTTAWDQISQLAHVDAVLWPEAVAGLGGALVIPWMARRLPPMWTALYAASWFIATCSTFWLSIPRFLLVAFPLIALLAWWGSRRWVHVPWVLASVGVLGFYSARFVRGVWAF